MNKKITFILMLGILTACSATTIPEFRSNGKYPIDFGDKQATSCSYFLLGIFGPLGNISLPQTAEKAGISQITYYDVSRSNYILYGKKCLNVYGR